MFLLIRDVRLLRLIQTQDSLWLGEQIIIWEHFFIYSYNILYSYILSLSQAENTR